MGQSNAEDIGGISVSIGADHSKLTNDIVAANAKLEEYAKQVYNAQVGATFVAPQAAARPAAARQPAAVSFGLGVATRVQAARAETSLQQAINAQLAKTGEHVNSQTGEVEKLTAAYSDQRTVVASIGQVAEHAAPLDPDTSGFQKNLDEILATLQAIAAEMQKVASQPIAPASAPRRPKAAKAATTAEAEEGSVPVAPRRRNITPRDIGTEADQRRVYTYDPAIYAEQDRQKEVKASRLREQLASQAAARQAPTGASDAQQGRAISDRERLNRERDLQELSREAQQGREASDARGGAPGRGIFAPELTPAGAEAKRQASAARASALLDSGLGPRPGGGPPPGGGADRAYEQQRARDARRAQRERDARASLRADQARDEEVFAKSQPSRAEARERQTQIAIERARSNITASARTARTASSGIGALLGGTQGKLIEANARVAESTKAVAEAQRAAEPFQRRIAEYDLDIAASSGKVAAARTKSKQAFVSDPKTQRALEDERKALLGQADALEKVRKLQGGGSVVRNLAAVSAASAVFGLTLKAVDVGLELGGKALEPFIRRMTGFASVSATVTDTLSTQTKQANGNVQAVTAMAEAQAGLSASSAAIINPLIAQRAAIEAGNKSMSDAVDLFETYQNLQDKGGAGITRETGGIAGSGFFGTHSTSQNIGNLLQGLPSALQAGPTVGGVGGPGPRGAVGPRIGASQAAQNLATFNAGLEFINAQLVKGGDAVHKFTTELKPAELKASIDAFRAAGASAEQINAMETRRIGVSGVTTAGQANRVLQSVNTGFQKVDPAVVQQGLDQQRSATIRAIGRQQVDTSQRQLPAQQALANLANPLQPVGTGQVAANAQEQSALNGRLKTTQGLQDTLNATYEHGMQVIRDTYDPAVIKAGGLEAVKAFHAGLEAVRQTGVQIASIQAGISNEQAAYQVAQYNYQLVIAKRTLADIGGLTNKNFGEGQSYFGVLERQNLALSRQGQLLQFNLAQRQINFRTALAGFQAPGVTPAERQARIAEAKIEADFAQKQLDIQTKMFGNQVQIVDIANLRQGVDLAGQIGLILQGRKVTIDTKDAEANLMRLQAIQQQNVAQVGTYMTAVDSLVSAAFSEIQQMEAAYGHAVAGITTTTLAQFGVYLTGMYAQIAAGPGGAPTSGGGGGGRRLMLASGGILNTSGPTRIGDGAIAGEAGSETLLVLSHPRAASGFAGGGGGGTIIINVNSPVVREEMDIAKITRSVTQALGREASAKGLRGLG